MSSLLLRLWCFLFIACCASIGCQDEPKTKPEIVEEAREDLGDAKSDIESAREEVAEQEQELDDALENVEEQRQELLEARKELGDAERQLEKEQADLEAAKALEPVQPISQQPE